MSPLSISKEATPIFAITTTTATATATATTTATTTTTTTVLSLSIGAHYFVLYLEYLSGF